LAVGDLWQPPSLYLLSPAAGWRGFLFFSPASRKDGLRAAIQLDSQEVVKHLLKVRPVAAARLHAHSQD